MARRSGYSAQKRRRELEKQRKREAKRERTHDRTPEDPDALVAEYLGLNVEPAEGEEEAGTEEGEETSKDDEGSEEQSTD